MLRFVDLERAFRRYGRELEEAVLEVLRSTRYILGPKVEELEERLSDYVGRQFAIGVSSGTDALYLILKALEIPSRSKVVVPSFTFIATAEVVVRAGLEPVFVDIDPNTLNLSVEKVRKLLEEVEGIRAVIAVSLFGVPAELEELEELCRAYGVYLIEDACQSLGSRLRGRPSGSFGVASATSFFPAKPLGAAGDGGMVFTDEEELAEKIRAMRVHGQVRRYFHLYQGINGRLDELQAAVLLVKLKYFEEELELRRRVAERYRRLLEGVRSLKFQKVPEGCLPSWAQFTVRVENRDALVEHLEKRGIPTAIYYPRPLHLQPVFSGLGYGEGDLPETERASKEVLSLPMHPYLTEEEQRRVTEAVKEFFS